LARREIAMSSIPKFAKYAAAFETAYASRDWKTLEPFFTDDAVYEVKDVPPPLGGVATGRDAILAYFERTTDSFDRKFATRTLLLREGPRDDGDSVWIRGGVRYTAPGVSDLEFELEETVWFSGDRIRRMEDRCAAAEVAKVQDWAHAHGEKIGLSIA
jgi:ketosteroid isomerase-like protein